MLLYGSETLKHLPVVKIKVERRRSIYQVPGHVVARWLEQGSGIEISSASDVGSTRSFRIAVLTFQLFQPFGASSTLHRQVASSFYPLTSYRLRTPTECDSCFDGQPVDAEEREASCSC